MLNNNNKPKKSKIKQKAIIFNQHKQQWILNIPTGNETFTHKGYKYVIDPRATTINLKETITDKLLNKTTIYYLYNINNPSPFKSNDKALEPLLKANDFNQLFDTKVINDVNNVGKGLFSNLDQKTLIMIIGGVLAIIYLIATGGI
ncbi:MAG: hypothetical protein ACLFVR_15700 [Thiohalospira sp.]